MAQWHRGELTVQIETKELKKLENQLKTFGARAYPFATKATINSAAWLTRSNAQENIGNQMQERNNWTRRSVQVEQARTLRVSSQEARVGSTLDYMEMQEFGGTKQEHTSRPTPTASGEGLQARPRKRLPRRPNKLSNITLRGKRIKGGRRQRNKVAVLMAAKSGNKYIYMDLGKRKGIFKIMGSKKRPKPRLVQDLSMTSVAIPRNPWLLPASNAAQAEIPRLYAEALKFQLKRNNILT